MAKEPGLGTSERYLIGAFRAANWPIAPLSLGLSMISGQTLRVCPEGKAVSIFPNHALNGRRGNEQSSNSCRKPVPGLRRMLFLFVELAAVHHRGRRSARSDSG